LQNDISSIGTCITITANNVTFDGQGHSINYGQNGLPGQGIIANSVNLTTVKNSIISEGDFGLVGNRHGIYLINNHDSEVFNNTVTTFGNNNFGIMLQSSSSNYIDNNHIDTSGISANNLQLQNGNGNVLANNILVSHGNSAQGLALIDSSDNEISSNLIVTDQMNANAIFISNSKDNSFFGDELSVSNADIVVLNDTSSDGNSFTSISIAQRNEVYNDILLNAEGIDGTSFVDTYLKKYLFSGLGSIISFKSSNFGEIIFLAPISGSGTDLSADVVIGDNSAVVQSDINSGLNQSAQITLYNLPTDFVNPEIKRDGLSCPLEVCMNLTDLNAGTVVFTVTGWSNYSIGEIV
jgi:parallel beta-helix repeat protein